MTEAIKIENLSASYGSNKALDNINLIVNTGEYLAIMGPNGGGKSTLLKAILGLIPINSGDITILGRNAREGRKSIGYVPQFSPVDKRFPISVKEVVMSGMLNGGLHPFFRYKKDHIEEAMENLHYVGIETLAERQISQLSGGEFQRMLIARALAGKPEILMLDEPTASVDPSSREKIYRLLEDLNSSKTIVLVTHDLLAISSSIKRIACINRGVVYHGKPELNQNIVDKMYGCDVDLIAHGVSHRVLNKHNHEGE